MCVQNTSDPTTPCQLLVRTPCCSSAIFYCFSERTGILTACSCCAGVMILRAKGAQDVDLIVEPDATFFKASWSKHTNFCQQDIEISQNSGQMAYGQEIQYQVSKLHLCRFSIERSQV